MKTMKTMTNDFDQLCVEARNFLDKKKHLFIGGEWVDAESGQILPVVDPSSGEVITQVPRGGTSDIDRAVKAARAALRDPAWSQMTPGERERLLHRFANVIESHGEELGQLEVVDVGMPRFLGQAMVSNVLQILRYMGGWPTKINGRTMDIGEPLPEGQRYFAYTLREPVGVVGAITPWNTPLMIAVWKIASALACGCTVVLKPSEVAPLSSLRLGELAQEAGIPPGVFNIVTGFGDEAGCSLVTHPQVDKITFTGSTSTGKAINKQATETMKNVTLELGGKSPVLVLNDVDLNKVAPMISMGIHGNTGQICVAGSRLYVQRGAYDELVERLAKAACGLKIGPGLCPDSQMGPLVSKGQLERVMGYVQSGVDSGGQVASGGQTIEGPGYYLEPTVLTHLPQDSPSMREEIFGPVIAVTPFDDLEEGLALSNDTSYGLASYLWTDNLQQAHNLIPKMQAGTVYVNSMPFPLVNMPFGGYKQSGLGQELGEATIAQYTQQKSVVMSLG